MADDFCEVMGMSRAGCAHCRPAAERRRLDALAVELDVKGGNTAPQREILGRTANWAITVAGYFGKCMTGCGDAIKPGDEIVRIDAGWSHLDCARELTRG